MSQEGQGRNFDAYAALGVARGASAEEIKKAFRRIAKDTHPDTHPGDAEAAAKYKAANAAYELLSDDAKRAKYDNSKRTTVTDTPRIRKDPRLDEALQRIRQQKDVRPPRPTQPVVQSERRPPRITLQNPPVRSSQSPPSNPAAELSSLRRTAFEASKTLMAVGEKTLRDGDRLTLSGGASYSFRRVLWAKPGDDRKFRTAKPMLCRGDEVLAEIQLIPGQNLVAASATSCRAFLAHEQSDLRNAIYNLTNQREFLDPIARELRSMMVAGETFSIDGLAIGPRRVEFQHGSTRSFAEVMCAGDQILELHDGDPVDARFRFADARTAHLISGSYLQVRRVVAARAKENGRAVPKLSPQRLLNGVRSAGSHLVNWQNHGMTD